MKRILVSSTQCNGANKDISISDYSSVQCNSYKKYVIVIKNNYKIHRKQSIEVVYIDLWQRVSSHEGDIWHRWVDRYYNIIKIYNN